MNLSILPHKTHFIVRDPVWGDILLPQKWMPLLASRDMQRLRGVLQLGTAGLVYPSANHTRFEHSLGVYHVARLLLEEMTRNRELEKAELTPADMEAFLAAALLHDLGHYPYSHVLEALGPYFEAHEKVTANLILQGEIGERLEAIGIDPQRVARIIDSHDGNNTDRRTKLLQNMLSNPFDPDKLDYLARDAHACGVPYGNIDTTRLLRSARISEDGTHLAITDKGIAPIESLIFATYMMYRNVYWHHTVCIANAMISRAVQDAIEDYGADPKALARLRDPQLLQEMRRIGNGRSSSAELVKAIETRDLYERAVVFQPGTYKQSKVGEYERQPKARKHKERQLCETFSALVGSPLRDYDLLIHVPFIDKAPRFDLEVFFRHPPSGKKNPLPFNSSEVSLLGPSLVHNFENQTKKMRVVCRRETFGNESGHQRSLAEMIRQQVRGNPRRFDIA